MIKAHKILTFTAIILFSCIAQAREMPYYATIKSNKANIRSGPSIRYPILWMYKRNNWPVKISATFERWRKVSDINGEIGWIHESLLSNRRFVVIKANGSLAMQRLPIENSTKVAILEDGVLGKLKECKEGWCKLITEGIEGWVPFNNLWGISTKDLENDN